MLNLGLKNTLKASAGQGISTDGFLVNADFNDLTSMFVGRDGSGGNPGPGDVVGLVLNKAGMGGQTAEAYIASRPNFADDFTNSDNWGTPTQGVTDNGNGTLTVADVGGTDGILSFQTTNSVGDWVYISVNIISATATNIAFRERNSAGAGTPLGSSSTAGAGIFTAFYKAGYENSNFALQVIPTDTSATIDSFDLKVIPNEHLTAPADNQRPLLDLTNGVYSLDYDGVDDGMSFDFEGGAGPADCSVFFAVKTGNSKNFNLFSKTGAAGRMVLAVNSDVSTDPTLNAGSPELIFDGVNYGASPTRDTVFDLLTVDAWIIGEARNADLTGWSDFVIGDLEFISGFELEGQLIGPIIVPNCTEKQRLEAMKLLRSRF